MSDFIAGHAVDASGQPIGPNVPDMTTSGELPQGMARKVFTMFADIEATERQQKVARFRDFEIRCDEPQWLGGDDEYPQPLTYLVAAVGF